MRVLQRVDLGKWYAVIVTGDRQKATDRQRPELVLNETGPEEEVPLLHDLRWNFAGPDKTGALLFDRLVG